MNECVIRFTEIKYMSLEIKDNELLKKYNKIWIKVSNMIEKAFGIQPEFGSKYLKTKLKYYDE